MLDDLRSHTLLGPVIKDHFLPMRPLGGRQPPMAPIHLPISLPVIILRMEAPECRMNTLYCVTTPMTVLIAHLPLSGLVSGVLLPLAFSLRRNLLLLIILI